MGNAFTGVQGQYFGIQQVSTGIWNIYELNSLLVLSSSGSVGTSVKLVYDISLYQLSPSTTFQWYFTFSEDFCSITIQSGTGLCLQNMGLNNPAQLQNCVSGSSNQKWTINPAQNSFQLFSISNGDTLSLANPTIIDTILTAVPYNSCSMNQFVFNKYGQLQRYIK